MGTEKERLKRWREKNRAEGKKSYTIMLSRDAQHILKREKERADATYSTVIERALLQFGNASTIPVPGREKSDTSNEIGVASNVTRNAGVERARLLIDDEVAMRGFSRNDEFGMDREGIEELRNGLIPRLLRMSKRRKFRLRK